ncbi:hypothetical protein F652_2684 [Enterobacteriaceae bacterium bta3-1]|nr:hypothetical protein F652_2684 [Enterobacteriaceae bacterium bta3-1]
MALFTWGYQCYSSKVTSKTIAALILVLCTNNGNAKNDR